MPRKSHRKGWGEVSTRKLTVEASVASSEDRFNFRASKNFERLSDAPFAVDTKAAFDEADKDKTETIFLNISQMPTSFCLILVLSSSQFKDELKNKNDRLGNQTRGCMMVGADRSAELWRPLLRDGNYLDWISRIETLTKVGVDLI